MSNEDKHEVEGPNTLDEIERFDFDRAADLMDIISKCAAVGGKASAIGGLAQTVLNEMSALAAEIGRRRNAELAAAEAERVAAIKAENRKATEEAEESDAKGPRRIPSTPQNSGLRAAADTPAPNGRRV